MSAPPSLSLAMPPRRQFIVGGCSPAGNENHRQDSRDMGSMLTGETGVANLHVSTELSCGLAPPSPLVINVYYTLPDDGTRLDQSSIDHVRCVAMTLWQLVQLWIQAQQDVTTLNEEIAQNNPVYFDAVARWRDELVAARDEPDYQLYHTDNKTRAPTTCSSAPTQDACRAPCNWWTVPFLSYFVRGACYPDAAYLAGLSHEFAKFDAPPPNYPVVAILMELGEMLAVDVKSTCQNFINGVISYGAMVAAAYVLATVASQGQDRFKGNVIMGHLAAYVANLRVPFSYQMVVAVLLLSNTLSLDPVRQPVPDDVDTSMVRLLASVFQVQAMAATDRFVRIYQTTGHGQAYRANVGEVSVIPNAYGAGGSTMHLATNAVGMATFMNMEKDMSGNTPIIRLRPIKGITAPDVVFELFAIVGPILRETSAQNTASSAIGRIRDLSRSMGDAVTAKDMFVRIDAERMRVIEQSIQQRTDIIAGYKPHVDSMKLDPLMADLIMMLDFAIVDHALRTDPLTTLTTLLKHHGPAVEEKFIEKLQAAINQEFAPVRMGDKYVRANIDQDDNLTSITYDKIQRGESVVTFANSVIESAIKARLERIFDDITSLQNEEVSLRIKSNYYTMGEKMRITNRESMATRALKFEIDTKFDLGDIKHGMAGLNEYDVEMIVRGVTLIEHKKNKEDKVGFIQGLPAVLDAENRGIVSVYGTVYEFLTGKKKIHSSIQAETDLNDELEVIYNQMAVNFNYAVWAARLGSENRGILGLLGGVSIREGIAGFFAVIVALIGLVGKCVSRGSRGGGGGNLEQEIPRNKKGMCQHILFDSKFNSFRRCRNRANAGPEFCSTHDGLN